MTTMIYPSKIGQHSTTNKRPLKVAIVAAYPQDPGGPSGGPEAGLSALIPFLSVFEDLELHVVTPDSTSRTNRIEVHGRVMIHRVPQASQGQLWNAIGPGRKQMSEYVMQLDPDVIHARDTCGLMIKDLPIPRVLSIHGFIHADTALQSRRLSWLRAKIWRHVELHAWSVYPHIISISPYVREHLNGIATGRIHDIENPVAKAFFEVQRHEHPRTILCTGQISHMKNTLMLVKAFGQLVSRGYDAQLRLAGSTRDFHYDCRVSKFISDHSLTDRVVRLGKITRAQVCVELAAASVFALISLQENAPLSVAEAMAIGVPVVTSNRCGMPYMVEDGESGFLVNPHNTDDIAGRLGELIDNQALRKRMGQRARRIAADRFHPAIIAQRTREVYLAAYQQPHQSNGPS